MQIQKDTCEQMASAEAKAGAGVVVMTNMGDERRLVAHYGPGPWVKMKLVHTCSDGRRRCVMPTESVNEMTRKEWLDLGFYYDRDDCEKIWKVSGAKSGLFKLSKLIEDYANDSENDVISHHENFGPYSYFEIGTWSEPEITGHWIAAPLDRLAALASDIFSIVQNGAVSQKILLRDRFSPNSPYELMLEIKDDDFLPYADDPELQG